MTPSRSLFCAVFAGALIGTLSVYAVRMPVFFDGSSIAVAAVLAFLGCLSAIAWMPEHWLWTDADRLAMAFRQYHKLSDLGANNALRTITETHERAESLRRHSLQFHDDLKHPLNAAADQLDASAREIFYQPSRLRALGPVLRRVELIEEATLAHKALRKRAQKNQATIALSREKLISALTAMDAAFSQTDLSAARGHLEQVDIASSVAERLLSPRTPLAPLKNGDLS